MADNEAKPKKLPKAYFVDAEGKVSRNPSETTVAVRSDFKDHDSVSQSVDDFPANIVRSLAWHGLKQLIGDSRADEVKKGAEAIHDGLLARLERLLGGDWVKEGERAGPRPTLLAEAVIRVLRERGDDVDEARAESIREKLKDKAVRESTMANATYAAMFEKIKAERQAERAKDAAKKAKEAAAAGGDATDTGPDF